MNDTFFGNVLVAQSGGPTAVINSSLAGVITEALNHECIGEIYGSLNGILGVLNENLIDLAAESQQVVRGLRTTPGSALGTCRYKVKSEEDLNRILEVFEAHDIRYFFYIGGNDSQDTANKISELAIQKEYPLRVIGVPKTVDNDLPVTSHCPGYGSAIKYLSTLVREVALDNASVGQHDFVSIIEAMGRDAGWITAGAALAKRPNHPEDPPHIMLLPELPFHLENFLNKVQEVLKKEKYCVVVASEGIRDAEGNYIAASGTQDAFGHQALGGVGEYLSEQLQRHLAVKARFCRPGISQRSAAHLASKTDAEEAFLVGQKAVQAASSGETDKMVTLVRDGESPICATGLVPLSEVANHVKAFPEAWIAEDGFGLTQQFVKYASPLVEGQVSLEYEAGLPIYAQLAATRVEPKLSSHTTTES